MCVPLFMLTQVKYKIVPANISMYLAGFSPNQFLACGGKSLSVSVGERARFVWWQFWKLSFKNSLSSVSVRAGCTFIGYTEVEITIFS